MQKDDSSWQPFWEVQRDVYRWALSPKGTELIPVNTRSTVLPLLRKELAQLEDGSWREELQKQIAKTQNLVESLKSQNLYPERIDGFKHAISQLEERLDALSG